MTHRDLLRRHGLFDAKVPRFTSYPPANRFSPEVGGADRTRWLSDTPDRSDISLYAHIPFCRRLCWFCACRTQGTKTDAPLARYVASLLDEAEAVRAILPVRIRTRRLHLGGGTPTILPAALMDRLLTGLAVRFGSADLDEFSVEIDPTEIDAERVAVLAAHGLNRASLGVQDFDPKVQEAIGRLQSVDDTRATAQMLANLGVTALNIDLLYGLPFQTRESLSRTLDDVVSLNPTRLALYGYAHVPWMSKRQQLIPSDALPGPEARFDLFQDARARLLLEGFVEIGIDHFARPGDSLAVARDEGRLARSFQGYTDDRVDRLIGLGASAISRFPEGYVQNHSATAKYQSEIAAGRSSSARGVRLTEADRAKGDIIEALMCYHAVSLDRLSDPVPEAADWLRDLAENAGDAVDFDGRRLSIRPWAHPLVRIFAARLGRTAAGAQTYSAAI